MAKYSAVKATVNAYIKQNGRKEITGKVLNAVLNATIDSLGKYFQFAGGALPTDNPGTPDQNVCYLAGEPGVYTNFGGITIENEEVALLFWNGEWTKQRILIGIREVNASVDNQVGTPSVDVSYSGGELVLTFHNLKGEHGDTGDTGDPAGFGTIGADINGGVGTPGVSVETSGDNTAKNLMFHFTNLKGETGVTSVVATIDDTSGTPSCQVSLVGQQLTLAFSGLKGLKGDTGVSADYPITIYNGLDSDATDQALAAAQGKVLDGKVSQLGQEVSGNEFAIFNEGKLSAKYVANEYVSQNTGEFVGYNGWSRTDYINVSPFKTLQINATRASVYNAFYKKDKTFLSGFALVVGDNTINIPEDANYIVLSTTTEDVVNNVITIDEYRFMDEKQTDDKIVSASVVSNNDVINQVLREVYFNFDLSSLVSIRLYKSGDARRFMFDTGYGDIKLILRNDGSFIGLDYATLSIIKCFGVMDVSKFDEYAGTTYYPVVFRDWCMLPTSSPMGVLEELAKPSNIRAISFTKTTGKKINTDGEVVDAGSSWFYTSPIQFKRGDVVSLRDIVGNSSVSIASFVITEGTEYTPVSNLKYSGIDGDNYTFVVEKDGSLSFSLNNGNGHYPCIYAISSDTIASLVDLIKTSQSGIRVVDNLTEGGHDDALSAEQGKTLKRLSDLNGNINCAPTSPSPVLKPYISRTPIDPASWSAGNNGTIDADTVEIFDEVNKCYRKSIKMNCYPLASGNNYSIFSATLSSPVNIKTTAMVGSIYLDPSIADADRGSILIRLYSGGSTANSATIYLWYLVDSEAGRTLYSRNYWYHFAINAYAAINSKTSGFDETNVTGVSIIYQNGYNTSPFIAISDIGFVATLHKPAISIVVDNYNQSVPNMADYAASKGVKLTTTIVPSYIGGAGSASLERIKDGKLQGNIIGNHTWSHQASMTTEAEYVDEIVKAERYMLTNGFIRGCKFISVPSATFNNLKYLAYCQTDAQMIYHNWIKGPQSLVDYPFYPCQREHNITVVDNNPSTPEAAAAVVVTMKANIQDAITYNGMAVLGFHGTFWEADNGVAWKDLIDYISELSNVDIVTVDELIEGTIV